MVTFGLLVALTLATTYLTAEGAAIGDAYRKSMVDDAPVSGAQCRFCSCRLPPNPKPRDLINHRLCIKRILDREGGTDVGGRWGRSVDDKFRRQMAKIVEEEALLGGGRKERLPRSLEALCAGDVSQYDHQVREYIQWRCENGYGQLTRRWGRSAPGALRFVTDVLADDAREVKRGLYRGRAKRDEAADVRALVEFFKAQQSQEGHSQNGGRWG